MVYRLFEGPHSGHDVEVVNPSVLWFGCKVGIKKPDGKIEGRKLLEWKECALVRCRTCLFSWTVLETEDPREANLEVLRVGDED